MNWSVIPNEERLYHWKKLRGELVGLSLHNQLEKIAKFCETLPRGRRTIDYYDATSWPTPWEIFFHAEFCVNSISLIIFHTLSLTNNTDNIELWVVKDNIGDYLLPIVNNQFVLNYEIGKVSNYSDIKDYFIVMRQFLKQDIKTIK